MTPRKAFPTESHLSRDDIERFSRMESNIEMMLQKLDEWRQESKESREAMKEEHHKQMRVLTTKVADIETWRATHVSPDDIANWNASAKWTARYQDRIGMLLAIAGFLFAVLSAIIGWAFNALVLPWLNGGK